jgi:pimeloyl-ACP methyl ester carboxylesterase
LLRDAPGRIRGAIFVGAFAEPPRPFLLRLAPVAARSAALIRSTPAFLLRQFCLGPDATAAQLTRLREALASVSPEVLGQRLSLIATHHSFGKTQIDVPSCYIRASQDRLVPSHCATWFQQKIRNCGLNEIDGPHFLLQARPREAAQAIVDFMNGLRGD